MKAIVFSHQRQNFTQEAINLGFAHIKGNITIQSASLCFSREEFFESFALKKGDSLIKNSMQSISFSREEFNLGFAHIKGDIK